MQKILVALVMILGTTVAHVGYAHAANLGIQCERLESSVKSCSKRKGSASSKVCAIHTKKFKKQCAAQEVCGQPAFKCEEGKVCIQVMPAVKTYSSLKELKAEKAYFLYYGQCLADEVL